MSAGGTPGWCEMFSWGGRVEEKGERREERGEKRGGEEERGGETKRLRRRRVEGETR